VPLVRRGVGAIVIVVLALLAFAAAPASASPNARFGIQDDAWLLYGPGSLDQRLTTLQGLGVGVVRVTLRWDKVAPTKPASPRAPEAYDWGLYGDVLDALHARGMTALVTLYGSPPWANGGQRENRLPTSGFGDFATAAAVRFPWVRLWTIWNEPNTATFSVPVSPSLYVRRLLNPGYAALKAASSRNLIAGGVTSPRKTPTGLSPLAFMQGMRAARAKLDAYAQNPYPLSRNETPSSGACTTCSYFTMATLPQLRAAVTRYFGNKQLWLTEYGYQTSPPDPLLGVSYAKQAQYLGEAASRVWRQAGVTMLIQFLVRDEPNIGGWQSGLYSASGAPKLAVKAFALPLAQIGRSGSRATVWGLVRPGAGARPYVLQRKLGARWVKIGATARTARSGAFTRTLSLPAGSEVRIFVPALGYASPGLTLR
jgi:hypothetical protein